MIGCCFSFFNQKRCFTSPTLKKRPSSKSCSKSNWIDIEGHFGMWMSRKYSKVQCCSQEFIHTHTHTHIQSSMPSNLQVKSRSRWKATLAEIMSEAQGIFLFQFGRVKNFSWMKIFILFIFYFLQCEAWGKYWNRSRGKLDFKGSSGKDYGTHGLNKVTYCSI